MTADSLVDLLLEMNVINVKDIDAEINKLAAKISDPRAQKWFKRVPRYWLINIDRLIQQPCPDCGGTGEKDNQTCPTCKGSGKQSVPYTAKAKPWGFFGRKYYADPKGGWVPGQEPPEIPAEEKGQPWGEKEFAGQLGACPKCSGTGRLKIIQHAETGQDITVPASPNLDTPEERARYERCPDCGGTGMSRTVESLVNRMLEATPFDPKKMDKRYGYERTPGAPGVYKSAMHEPTVQHDIEQSFTPFKPSKAKANEPYGGPPTKKQLQPWMTASGAEKKEFHHFDPIQFRRRDLWGRLINAVNYLNYLYRLTQKHEFEQPGEQAEAQEAENILRRLVSMKPDDIQGFQEIMAAAEQHRHELKSDPGKFAKDGKVIAAINNLQMRRALFDYTIAALSARPTRTPTGVRDPEQAGMYLPNWTTRNEEEAARFSENGQVYFIDREQQPWLFAFFSNNAQDYRMQNQIKQVDGHDIDENIARQIAPLFQDRQRFTDEMLVRMPVLARVVDVPDRAQPVFDFPDGWRLVRLDQPFDLQREGVAMSHCVGNNTYVEKLNRGTTQFYSLRDPENHPHVTLELQRPNNVQQMKGIRNSTTFTPDIKQRLRQVIQNYGWHVTGDTEAVR